MPEATRDTSFKPPQKATYPGTPEPDLGPGRPLPAWSGRSGETEKSHTILLCCRQVNRIYCLVSFFQLLVGEWGQVAQAGQELGHLVRSSEPSQTFGKEKFNSRTQERKLGGITTGRKDCGPSPGTRELVANNWEV